MEKKKIRVKDIEVAYYESRTDGVPVLMIHGDSLSSDIFRAQFRGHLNKQFRLIALDLPGHGDSSHCTDVDKFYTFEGLLDILQAFIRKIYIENAFIIGHSLGGHLGIQLLDKIAWLKGIVILGTSPYIDADFFDKAFLNTAVLSLRFKKELTAEDIEMLADNYISNSGKQLVKDFFSRTDPAFRERLGKAYENNEIPNDISILENTDKPVAIFHGVDDKLVDLDFLRSLNIENLWKTDIQLIEKAGHCAQYENPGRFNQLLEYYLLAY